MKEIKGLKQRYTTTCTSIPTRPGCWDVLNVEIFDNGEKIGEYKRNYSSFYNTFFPFEKNGKHYALYSKDYQTTSVMSLPDCQHIADTESYFCPVDFYVPDFEYVKIGKEVNEESLSKAIADGVEKNILFYTKQLDITNEQLKQIGQKGLVSGCVWGDISGGWKVMLLDLSEIENGKIALTRDFGYLQLPPIPLLLEEMVQWEEPHRLTIPVSMEYEFHADPEKSGFLGYSIEDLKFYSGHFYDHVKVTRVDKKEVK